MGGGRGLISYTVGRDERRMGGDWGKGDLERILDSWKRKRRKETGAEYYETVKQTDRQAQL